MTDPTTPNTPTDMGAPALFDLPSPTQESPPARGQWLAHPLAPIIVGTMVLLAVGVWLATHLGVMRPLGTPAVVTFDPVRFMNAQRAAASILAHTPNADLAFALTQVARQAEQVIQEEARGALVIVRQAVVAPTAGVEDITDAVIQRFGLDPNVPTVTTDIGDSLEDVAPTNSSFSRGKLAEDYRLELERRDAERAAKEALKSKHDQVVP